MGKLNDPQTSGTKWCPDCEKNLHPLMFGADPRSSCGLQTYCRPCCSKRSQNTPSARRAKRARARTRTQKAMVDKPEVRLYGEAY